MRLNKINFRISLILCMLEIKATYIMKKKTVLRANLHSGNEFILRRAKENFWYTIVS